MVQADILKSLNDGSAPKHLRIFAAQGLAPLPPREMLDLLVRLSEDADSQIASQASHTLKNWPEDQILSQVQDRDCHVRVLEYFATKAAAAAILEAIVLNPSTPGSVVAQLALASSPSLLETILYNRVRLLECPEILQNVKLNPSITGEARRLVQEIEVEFFSSKKKQYTVERSAETVASSAQSVELESESLPEDLCLEGLPLDPEERESAILERLAKMTVRQKIWHARFGAREVRAILIRDSNKEVASTVLQSPKLTENEVGAFAAMRSVSDEILRQIGNSREWTRGYTVIHNLVKNPKTPPLISQRMLFRLQTKDLKLLTRDRSIPEAVRRNAQRTLNERSASRNAL
jgi:hypothetical protein